MSREFKVGLFITITTIIIVASLLYLAHEKGLFAKIYTFTLSSKSGDGLTEGMPVVVTTNLKGRELEKMFSKHIGPAIVNRLRRMCIPIDFDPVDFDDAAALAAIQAQMRDEYAATGEAIRAYHLGEP